ncbi:Mth938-like domain-containing protein [Neisseria sp. 83E34]|uniref:Mth938-like domain-containing protein n=1 Tax=Neisseria sp. 83E34 TaxID=1692264 RepID=UPI0006CE978E|nr:Mth938-like domain-containing protein [Neisseria sp. 83E34]KPN70660.1 rod shape-determining protein RodA [Neisseria sp. 83E34]
MHIEENRPQNTLAITACDTDKIEINGTGHSLPLCITEKEILPISQVSLQTVDDQFFLSQFENTLPPEVILVGTGRKHSFLHPKITAKLAAKGIGLETMTTPAACRTFMILQSEGRRVWAWLWP